MKMKICNGKLCKGKEKPISEFSKASRNKDELQSQCKVCENEYQKEFRKKFPCKAIFKNIKSRCNNPNAYKYKNYGGRVLSV